MRPKANKGKFAYGENMQGETPSGTATVLAFATCRFQATRNKE